MKEYWVWVTREEAQEPCLEPLEMNKIEHTEVVVKYNTY